MVLHGSPWVYMHSYCHQMITQICTTPSGVITHHPKIVIVRLTGPYGGPI